MDALYLYLALSTFDQITQEDVNTSYCIIKVYMLCSSLAYYGVQKLGSELIFSIGDLIFTSNLYTLMTDLCCEQQYKVANR